MSSKYLVLNGSSQVVSSSMFWDVHPDFREALDKHLFYKHKYILNATPWMIWTRTREGMEVPTRGIVFGWVPCIYGALVCMEFSTIQVVKDWSTSQVYNPDLPVTVIGFGEYTAIAYGNTMKDFSMLLLSNHSDLALFKKERKKLVEFIDRNNIEIVGI